MVNPKTTDIIILARGGSKGIPKKNVKPFLGIPLVELSIKQAINSNYVRNIYLSSDCPEILSKANKYEKVRLSSSRNMPNEYTHMIKTNVIGIIFIFF